MQSDEEANTALNMAPETCSDDEAPVSKSKPQKKSKLAGKGKAPARSAFDLLAENEDDDAEEAAEAQAADHESSEKVCCRRMK